MRLLCLVLAPALALSCADSHDASSAPRGPGFGADDGYEQTCGGANDCPPGYYCNAFGLCSPLAGSADAGVGGESGGSGSGSGLPPEVELRSEPPAIGDRYVYVALPDQDSVARIDSVDLGVRTIGVGDAPGALRTVPGQDVAVVLNRGSASVSVIRAQSAGTDTVIELPVVRGLNALAMAPDGRHAIATVDLRQTNGLTVDQPLQEVSVLRLVAGEERAIDVAVGFGPSDVQFSADSRVAFIVTERSLAIIELDTLDQATFIPGIPLSADPLQESPPQEVQVTSDGKWALVRIPGRPVLRVVDLQTEQLTDLQLAAPPTDVDLTPDGLQALVVLREARQALLVDLPGDIADPSAIQQVSTGDYVAGQATLTPDGKTALLFSNATDQEVLMRLQLDGGALSVQPLKKGVRSVIPAPDGRTAVVLHNRVAGSTQVGETLEQQIDRSYGYSLLDMQSGFVKLQSAPADLGPLAFAPDGASAYLLFDSRANGTLGAGSARVIDLIDLRSFLVDREALGSPPVAVGVVPSSAQVYVAQQHALGRISFIDTDARTMRTLTGFTLNSQIIE